MLYGQQFFINYLHQPQIARTDIDINFGNPSIEVPNLEKNEDIENIYKQHNLTKKKENISCNDKA